MSDDKLIRAGDPHDVAKYGQARIEAGQVTRPGMVVTTSLRPAAPGGSSGTPQVGITSQPVASNNGSETGNAKK